jgi:hypothetical protein
MLTQTAFTLSLEIVYINREVNFHHFLNARQELYEFASELFEEAVLWVNRGQFRLEYAL